MSDWNWFFSSVAQSIAALDGTLVAFVVAKLVNSQADYSRQQQQASDLFVRAERLRDAASNRFWDWYNQREVSHLIAELERIEKENARRLSAEEYSNTARLPEFLSRKRSLEVIAEWLDKREKEDREEDERREADRRTRRDLISPLSGLHVPDIRPIQHTTNLMLERAAAQEEFDREREAIRQLRVEVHDCIRIARILEHDLRDTPPYSSLVKWTLIAALGLFVFGVIYPLSFLPVPDGWEPELHLSAFLEILCSLRGVVLTIPVIVFGGLIGALLLLNDSLRHPATRLEQLKIWTEDGQYSQHFAVWRENQDAIASLRVV